MNERGESLLIYCRNFIVYLKKNEDCSLADARASRRKTAVTVWQIIATNLFCMGLPYIPKYGPRHAPVDKIHGQSAIRKVWHVLHGIYFVWALEHRVHYRNACIYSQCL